MTYDSPYLAPLETERLLIRPMTWDDLPWFIATHNDLDVTQHLLMNVVWTPEIAERFLGELLQHYADEGMGHMAVVRKSDGVLLGRCGLSEWIIDGEIELGYTFAKSSWGGGYAIEAARAQRDRAFREIGLHRVISLIMVPNLASAKVAIRNGMHKERELPRAGRTTAIWSIGRTHWEALQELGVNLKL